MSSEPIFVEEGVARCAWCAPSAQLRAYHDEEWGFPVGDDRHLFEKLCLEAFQSGLSWRTILAKRDNFRRAFSRFEIERVARFADAEVKRLLADEGIVRHRGKIEAVIHNAQRAEALIARAGSLSAFVWRFEPKEHEPAPAASSSPESIALAKALKRERWKFVGPTTAYAFMQSMGLVNDHHPACATHAAVEAARAAFERPVVDGAEVSR